MNNWIQIKGVVKAGHGVASGKSSDPRFPAGTIAMQKACFQERGLSLDDYYLGTINLSIAPHQYKAKQAKYTFRQVKWSNNDPAEDFSFFDCRIIIGNQQAIKGLIYYPHPETKPEHFQPPDILEIMSSFIQNLHYGNEVIIEVNPQQIEIS
ncbi:hypothetical protein [Synechocystis salina]|uniref:Uncharacterized protein n=1 Tax=Synechocystis salina LEGE 00031 TaxID=1828736 RepID=A0ABR9VWN6_9SYNC|nr:hypothetical protein [Synechocystis salina]MBE9242375.1 hypothetical protein [Synechocystis salina LEGE 00041]MBE9255431.1 hypothetical protein [Synechocystis salina LEGE 00031]